MRDWQQGCHENFGRLLTNFRHEAIINTILRGFSSSGRAPPCQGGGSEFESRNPLQFIAGVSLPAVFLRCHNPRELVKNAGLMKKVLDNSAPEVIIKNS